MNEKKAIEILNSQIKKLQSSKENRSYSWNLETETYLKKIFGENSKQGDFFHYRSWSYEMGFDPDENEKEIIQFLSDCIDTIKNIGIYKEPKRNFFSQLNDGLIVLIITGISTGSFILGKYVSDIQNFELKQENKELIQKLSKFKKTYKIVKKQ